jgi:hypothetical protein
MFKLFSLISTNIGSKSSYNTAAAVALKVITGTRTFFFLLKLFTAIERCNAAVQEFNPIV